MSVSSKLNISKCMYTEFQPAKKELHIHAEARKRVGIVTKINMFLVTHVTLLIQHI
jgi:hypothetical protein